MKCNVGKNDRVLRIIIGLLVLSAGLMFSSWWGLIGLVPLLTGIMKWCPAYCPLNISTCSTDKK